MTGRGTALLLVLAAAATALAVAMGAVAVAAAVWFLAPTSAEVGVARTAVVIPEATPVRPTPPAPPPADPTAVATPTPIPPVDWPELPDVAAREPLLETESFAVHAADPDDELLARAVAAWGPRLEGILAEGAARAGRTLPRTPVHVVFDRAYDARCPARGLAAPAHDPPLTVVYLTPETTDAHVGGVLAHEIAHHISATESFVGDGILTEGVANWIASEAMLAWLGHASWDEAVHRFLLSGSYVSLTDPQPLSPSRFEDCIERRDRVYSIRTSFVDWLVANYGLETVLAMPYREVSADTADGGTVTHREPDYLTATGHRLPELERLWLEHVLGRGDVSTLMVRGK